MERNNLKILPRFLKKYLFIFIWKADLKRKKSKKYIEIFYERVHFPSGHNRARPEARIFLQVSHSDAVAQQLELSSTVLPRHKKGAGLELEHPGLQLVSI